MLYRYEYVCLCDRWNAIRFLLMVQKDVDPYETHTISLAAASVCHNLTLPKDFTLNFDTCYRGSAIYTKWFDWSIASPNHKTRNRFKLVPSCCGATVLLIVCVFWVCNIVSTVQIQYWCFAIFWDSTACSAMSRYVSNSLRQAILVVIDTSISANDIASPICAVYFRFGS